jgi:hypothetical protein
VFNVDDNLLAAIGYNVATLSEEKKNQYRREISEELNQRASTEVLARLSKQEALEFEDVNRSPDRARRWLAEFHGDYASRQDYQAIRELFETDEDAMSFYASALWMRYAVPDYGKIMQEVMNEYVEELADMRRAVNEQLGIA